jgi:uncharacterized membrane-anchored protein YjiN (DUF445 family)
MFNAGLYSSIINHNSSAAIGFSILKDLHNKEYEKHNNNYEQRVKHNNNYEQRVKHTRTYIIPEESVRCTSITKKGQRCMCRKLKESDYCVTHNNKFNSKLTAKIIQEEKIEKPINRTWKNLYGLIN